MVETNSKAQIPEVKAAALKESQPLGQRIAQLGIPAQEMTETVTLAVSALLEKVEDLTRELEEERELRAHLEQQADSDSLVPVPNRRAFIRRLDWAISMFQRYGHPCSVIYYDLNGFKAINDRYSHAAGDEVIRIVAGVLVRSMRSSDFVARIGGDEFVVLLYHARLDAARRRASVIARRIAEQEYICSGEILDVSASYGAYQVQAGDTAESAIHHADKAMYEHKKALQQ